MLRLKDKIEASVTYADNAGTADSAKVATKLGSTGVGNMANFIYLNAGIPTASTSTIGGSTTPIYMKSGVMTPCAYSLNATVPPNAKFTDTNTWRGIQDNLTSDSTTESLSAAQGKVLKGLVDTAANSGDFSSDTIEGLLKKVQGLSPRMGSANITNDSRIAAIWWNFIYCPHRNGIGGDNPDYGTLLLFPMTAETSSFICRCGRSGSVNSIRRIYTSSDYTVTWDNISGKPSSYPPSEHSHSYLPLSGGNLSGDISFAAIGDTGKSAGLSWSGSTDGAGIYYQVTAADQGNLVLNLTDDDNCYLRIAKNGSFTAYVTPNGAAYFSSVYNAVYNDYAEFFPRGEATEPGDIVALDLTSDHESYIKATATSKIVAGVHSDEYAMLIGGDKVDDGSYVEKNLINYIPVSLAGRVMCKVTGPVHRGDTIIVSDIPGVGIATDDENIPYKRVVGYVVEDDDRTDIRRVKIRVKG